ncbi:MAG: sigma-70 family RNA polymerase sigma factor [Planctomycetota bacterium]
MSLDALLDEARRGSPDAFSELIVRYHAPVRAFLTTRLADVDLADDLCQEVFLAAFRGVDRFRRDSDFQTWLFAIAKKKASTFLKREMARREQEGGDFNLALLHWRANRHAEWSGFNAEDEFSALRGCLRDLPPTDKSIVSAHYFDRQSLKSIAENAGKNAGAVRMQLSRIRKALLACIRHKMGAKGGES